MYLIFLHKGAIEELYPIKHCLQRHCKSLFCRTIIFTYFLLLFNFSISSNSNCFPFCTSCCSLKNNKYGTPPVHVQYRRCITNHFAYSEFVIVTTEVGNHA